MSEKPAESDAASQDEKDKGAETDISDILFEQGRRGIGNIAAGADARTGLTGDAFPVAESVRFELEAGRAHFLTGGAAPQAVLRVPVEGGKGQDGQDREKGAHGTEKLAEEPALQAHAGNDRQQAQDPDQAPAFRKSEGREPGKDIPGAGPLQDSCRPEGGQHDHKDQVDVLQFLKIREIFLRKGELPVPFEDFFLKKTREPVAQVAQGSEGTHISTEKPAEQDREDAQTDQSRQKAGRPDHYPAADLSENIFDPVKARHEGPRHGQEEKELYGRSRDRPVPVRELPGLPGCQRAVAGPLYILLKP